MAKTSTISTVPIATTASERRPHTKSTTDFRSPLCERDVSRANAIDSTYHLHVAALDGAGDDARTGEHGFHREFDVLGDGACVPIARAAARRQDGRNQRVDELLDVSRLLDAVPNVLQRLDF